MTLTEKLADAEAQYHMLLTGQAARVFVDQNGERVEYVSANRGALARYIESLKAQISHKRPSGPMGVWF